MKQSPLKVLLVDEGMNTGFHDASKIGGGQVARRRFFSDPEQFQVTVLTSETEIARFWEDLAAVIYEPSLQTYRPPRIHVAKKRVKWFSLLRDSFRAARILNRHLAAADADVVFLNDNKSRIIYILGWLLNRSGKRPARAAIQVDGEWKLGAFDSLMKFLYLLSFDKIICPTNAVRRTLGVPANWYSRKLLTAYPGVAIPDENEMQMTLEKKPSGDIIFGCIGTLWAAVKGQDIIIRAVDRLIKKNGHMPFKVHFYGDGPDRRVLENLIQELDVDAYFEFKGYVPDQKQIYSQIDACIVASRTETASIVIMECLVRNIPVIAADLDGCKEILTNFYDDFLFEQGNDGALALKLESALKDKVLENVREHIRKTDKQIITKDYQVKRVYEFLSD